MEAFWFSFFLILSSLTFSFFQGILVGGELSDLNEQNQVKAQKSGIFIDQNIARTAFLFFELLFYFLSFYIISILSFLAALLNSWYIVFLFLIFLGFSLYILRTIIFAYSSKYSKQLLNFFFPIVNFVYGIIKFAGFFHQFMLKKINPPKEEVLLEDIQEVVETALDEGAIQTGEYKIFSNLIKFNQVPVSDVMTPRTVIFSCNAELTVKEAIKLAELKVFSRFPIYDGESLDDKIVGYVVTKDVLQFALNQNWDTKLKELAREIHYVPENVTLDDALNQFLTKRQHIFLVVDEFGNITGLLTMEDLIETILGEEIVDEADKYIDLRQVAKKYREERMKRFMTQQTLNQNEN
ncbi:MAG: CBS domain-containing protein [Ignavibacteria bacterium]|nr:CBS domain-containing protein [Ignavibacteria bacterium]